MKEKCSATGWSHATTSSPLIWRELLDRGGKGAYLGGLTEFEDYLRHYYHLTPPTLDTMQIASENLATLHTELLEAQQNQPPKPLHVCITNSSSELAYQLAPLLLSQQVFGDRPLQIHLFDCPEKQEVLEGVAMELQDLAHPRLAGVTCTSSVAEAFCAISAAFILDYPHTPSSSSSKKSNQENVELAAAARMYHHYAVVMDYGSQKNVHVVIAGRYSNTAAALMARTVSSIDGQCFLASSALAEQQASSILASKLNVSPADVQQVGIWGMSSGDCIVDTSSMQVQHYRGSIVGPDPFSLTLQECLFDPQWLQEELPLQLAARHNCCEGYGPQGAPLAEAVAMSRLMSDWACGEGSLWHSVGLLSGDREGMSVAKSRPYLCQEGVWREAELGTAEPPLQQQVDTLEQELSAALEAIKQQQCAGSPVGHAVYSKL